MDKAREKISTMDKDITKMQKKLINLRKGVKILLTQLQDCGQIPNWTPSEEDLRG
jgi:hypothetical protein